MGLQVNKAPIALAWRDAAATLQELASELHDEALALEIRAQRFIELADALDAPRPTLHAVQDEPA